MTTNWLTVLREAAQISTHPDNRHLASQCRDAEAGNADALADCARIAGPGLAAAQARERVTSRYTCALCHERSWNQVCLTCAPDQHPSMLDPLYDLHAETRRLAARS